MSRLSKEELARFGGAEWALRLADERGLDGAKAELERRGIKGIPLAAKQADLDRFCEEEKANTIITLMLMAAACLYDEFDFTPEQIDQFLQRFNNKTACLVGGFVNWQELRDALKEETGIAIELPEVFTKEIR